MGIEGSLLKFLSTIRPRIELLFKSHLYGSKEPRGMEPTLPVWLYLMLPTANIGSRELFTQRDALSESR